MDGKKIPIGVSDFKEIIEENYYYVDKSLLIKEIIEDGSKIILLPRPRRFGKTLNMTMLSYFFEKSTVNCHHLFDNLQVSNYPFIMRLQGTKTVIYLTFKDVKYSDWDTCLSSFRSMIAKCYLLHNEMIESDLFNVSEKTYFEDIIWKRSNLADLGNSLLTLCEYIYRFSGEKTVILIDEYDTPIYSAWSKGYYNEMIGFIRSFLGSALKDNKHLEKAVLTGIMRIAKESIFSGLNNLNVATLLQKGYEDKFGFLESEVEILLNNIGIPYDMSEVQSWYNGYVFGGKVIYNPWSVLNYAHKYEDGFKPYWVNTASNDLIQDLLTHAESQVKQEMEVLISGGEIIKAVREDTILTEIGCNAETVWSFLLFSGYLKAVDTWMEEETTMCRLKIPNREVRYVFNEIIRNWMNKGVRGYDYSLMLNSLTSGDVKTFGKLFRDTVEKSLSYFDVGGNEPEKFYHAFVLGLMVSLSGKYLIKSNRESGYGRYDVMLIPADKNSAGCVLEFKKVEEDEGENLDTAAEAALQQIKDKDYQKELESLGVNKMIAVGISFHGKKVRVMGSQG